MAEAAPQGNFTIARGMHRQLCAANNKLKRSVRQNIFSIDCPECRSRAVKILNEYLSKSTCPKDEQ